MVAGIGLVAGVNAPTIIAAVALTVVVSSMSAFAVRSRLGRALTIQTEQAQLARADRAVLAERTRIARELHDVVAHHMSMLVVQAETAPFRVAGLSEPARAEFASMSQTARAALAEMRQLLDVLRADQPTGRQPQPRLADVADLVDSVRSAGAQVGLTAPTEMSVVAPVVAACAYRIVQESLSNATRHAPGAPITVVIDRAGTTLVLEVQNAPAPARTLTSPRINWLARRSRAATSAGHGLSGMRERAALLGGSLSAGPTSDGGYLVTARLPAPEGGQR
jgi:signal transduction histidine kinase